MASLYLMGFMGTGKSAVSRHLARDLDLSLLDLDHEIEHLTGSSITNFFASHGETAFRAIETRALESTIGKTAVISLGGGVPTQEINREILKNLARTGHLVVYLQARPATLAYRIRRQPGKRPVIDGNGYLDYDGTRKRVAELLEQRDPWYRECANYLVNTDDRNIEDIAEDIAGEWRRRSEIIS